MTRKALTVETEMRGRIETLGNQIESYNDESARWRESIVWNDETVAILTKLRDGYVSLLGLAEAQE